MASHSRRTGPGKQSTISAVESLDGHDETQAHDSSDLEPEVSKSDILVEFVDEPDPDDEDEDMDDSEVDEGPRGGRRRKRKTRMQLLEHDPVSAYVQETKRLPILSREQEHDLAVRFVEDGDTDAARRLIESNLRLVVKIAYEYRRAHRNLLDLIQEGNIGLMQAVKKYDPYRGVKLSSYAAWWIRAYILKFVLANWRMVKIGTTQTQRKLFFNLRKEKERLEQLGFHPTPALLAESLDVNEKDVIEMEKRLSSPDTSLDAPVGVDDDGGIKTRLDTLVLGEDERPDLKAASQEVQDLFRTKLDAFGEMLDGRDATIFRDRMLADNPLTLQEIGDRYGVSRERARQLEKRIVKKLRLYLEEELGTEVDIAAMMGE